MAQWLEREFTNRKIRGSNPTSASRLPLSRPGQPVSIPAFVPPSGGMAARHRKDVTAERFFIMVQWIMEVHDPHTVVLSILTSAKTASKLDIAQCELTVQKVRGSNPVSRLLLSKLGQRDSSSALTLPLGGMVARHRKDFYNRMVIFITIPFCHMVSRVRSRGLTEIIFGYYRLYGTLPIFLASHVKRWSKWLEREFTVRKVRGSNSTSASRLSLSRLGQPGSIPALLQPSELIFLLTSPSPSLTWDSHF
ncbi:hypothetical protein CSKR_112781 [Clonorchis sinensis]|uniref:Uncharacterized protein n=1 Tax=Clonorchis sinensis TaxID=79923 RepID=A0A419PUA6_CLOSI|nr:hypothetical protein CSKR_112781 [Clonorchis sinensis]